MPKINRREVAKQLGISAWSVGLLVRTRRLPHYRVGRRIVFDADEISQWLAARRIAEGSAPGIAPAPAEGRRQATGSGRRLR